MATREVVRVIQPTPRGWFSRLVWRWVRYDQPSDGDIKLTIVPGTQAVGLLSATWEEWPFDIELTHEFPGDEKAASATGASHD